MTTFTRFAFFTVARDSTFVTLAATTLMLAFNFDPALAFKIGAVVALIFSILLLIHSHFFTGERFVRSETWRALLSEERPAGEQERDLARAQLGELLLRFAMDAAGVAGVPLLFRLGVSYVSRQGEL